MKNTKKCDASTRVFKTLLYLINNPASIQELSDYIKKESSNDDIDTYTPEAILKYITTLKIYGIKIIREKDKYIILNYPPFLNFNEADLKGLTVLQSIKYPDKKTEENINELIKNIKLKIRDENIINYSKKDITPQITALYKDYEDLINQLERNLKEGNIIKLETINGKTYTAQPIDLYYKDNKVLYTLYSTLKAKKYDIDITKIKTIESLKTIKNNTQPSINVIKYRLSHRLAKSYTLKEGEIAKKLFSGKLEISNTEEAENSLIYRLLRYGNLCEILSPFDTRDKMAKLLERMELLYEE